MKPVDPISPVTEHDERRRSAPEPSSTPPWLAHKFGGSSLADAGRIRDVAAIVTSRQADSPQIVVVSAMQGVTNALLALSASAARRDDSWRPRLTELHERHASVAKDLLHTEAVRGLTDSLAKLSIELEAVLHAIELIGAEPADARDWIAGLGEVMCAQLVAARLHGRYLDAREVLVVRPTDRGPVPDWEVSATRLASWLAQRPHSADGATHPVIVATGFVARDTTGRATTLGRNGSDYSGAIFAALFDACELHIWTDVDGVLSADPRRVPEATLVPHLSYEEACELSYFGAKVVHPQTMQPVIDKRIPLRIRNTFNPSDPGTSIGPRTSERADLGAVTGLTTIDGLALLDVVGTGLLGVPGTAERLFGALRIAGISVVMISQGSSEHSICCAIDATHAERAVAALTDAFAAELARGQVEKVVARDGISLLAAVGDRMAGKPGVAARLFDALARAHVNVRAIAQGATERNISVAIDAVDATRALRAAHAAFYLSAQTMSVGLIGLGHVGRALLVQLDAARDRLLREQRIDLRVRAITNSRNLLLGERAPPPPAVADALRASPHADLEAFAAHVSAPHLPHAVIIDCSASNGVADNYASWLARGIHVITPNKHAGSGDVARWRAIRDATHASGARFRYEATVGAGLPVIQTLRDLVDTGDDVLAIEGMLSGTLAWLFEGYDGSEPFSQRLLAARAAGYTEPDPRDDLSGRDVARKLVILAREAGFELALDDVEVESLVPAGLESLALDEFLTRAPELDAPMKARLDAARGEGRVLRYVARLGAERRATVRLATLDPTHPFAHARGTDNVVQFITRRYHDRPLVVQGPGAGPDVTAAGIFADLLRIATHLGAAR